MRVRSGKVEPSAAVKGYTTSESMFDTAGDSCAPPSADQYPKLLITPKQERSTREGIGKQLRRQDRVWCYPGRGTPSAPRTAVATPTAVEGTPASMNGIVLNLETRVKSNRVTVVPKLSSKTEKTMRVSTRPRGSVLSINLTMTRLFLTLKESQRNVVLVRVAVVIFQAV